MTGILRVFDCNLYTSHECFVAMFSSSSLECGDEEAHVQLRVQIAPFTADLDLHPEPRTDGVSCSQHY